MQHASRCQLATVGNSTKVTRFRFGRKRKTQGRVLSANCYFALAAIFFTIASTNLRSLSLRLTV